MKTLTTIITLGIAVLCLPVLADNKHDHSGHDAAATSQPAAKEATQRIGDPWPMDTCIVSGEKLGSMGDPITKLHERREVRFCCSGCIDPFEADPAKYLEAADKKIIEQQLEYYPLTYCIIDTNEKVSNDPESNAFDVVGNRLFVYCCPPCGDDVRKDPAKYVGILDKAVIEQQSESYPLETCVVSGEALDSMGGPINVVIANQLVKLCCEGCKKQVDKDPAGTLAKIATAKN